MYPDRGALPGCLLQLLGLVLPHNEGHHPCGPPSLSPKKSTLERLRLGDAQGSDWIANPQMGSVDWESSFRIPTSNTTNSNSDSTILAKLFFSPSKSYWISFPSPSRGQG